jgi:adhesin/invasin
LGFLAIPTATAGAATPKVSTGSQIGTYVPVTPTRITDTRAGSGAPNAGDTLSSNQSLTVQVGNLGGVVPANAAVAVLNVTAINPTQSGFLSVNPAGQSGPATVSNLNFVAGQTVANLVTVPLNGGAVSIYNFFGNTDVAVDVFGYYSATPAADGSGLFNATSPVRVLGTGPLGAALGPNSVTPVQVTGGSTGVPAGATAVVVNLTAAHGTLPGYLTAYADGTTRPLASNLNFVANQTVANRATVPVSSSGQIDIYNLQGTVNVDADVSGYYTGAGGTGSAFVPITPQRLTDTRTGTNGTPIASNTTETFNLSNTNVPSTATAVATNVTAIAGNAPGFLTVFPTSDATPPLASDVNWSANQIVPNFTIADTAGTGNVNIFNFIGATTNVAIDAFGYFTPPTAPVTVTASPATIPSGEHSSTITVLVAQPNGTPVSGDPVQLTTSGAAGVCGSLPSSGTTNSAGKVVVTYDAGNNNGVCTITALEANGGKTGTGTVTQGNDIGLSAETPSVPANGTSTDLLTAHVTSNGSGVSGDVVHFSTGVANPAGACGTLQGGGVATTNGSGDASVNYIPSTTPGFCPVGAVETGTGQTSNIVTITQTASAPVAFNVAVTATPSSIVANGTSTSTIKATVTTATSAPVPNDTVSFVTDGAGTLAPQFATTNASGVATTTYTSSTAVNDWTITATEANAGVSGSTTVTQTAPPNVVTLTAAPTSLPANGTSQSTLTVTSTNGDGTPSAGQGVIITATGASCGLVTGPAGLITASGVYTTTYQAGTSSGFCALTATAGGTPTAGPTVIDQTSNPVPNPPNTITASASPTTIVGNGSSTSTITVTVLASNNTPVNGDPVNIAAPGTACGTLSSNSGTTNSSGVATFTYTSKAAAGTCTIGVAEANSGATGSTTVTQTAAQNTVAITPPTATVIATGTATQLFTAHVAPALLGGSVANDTVTFTLSGSPSAACGTVNPTSGSTGAGTSVQTVYQSSTTPGFCTITATESATGASSTALVDQTANPTPIGTQTATTASPTSIAADGTSHSTISTTVLTAGSAPVVGDTVMFTKSAPGGSLSNTFGVTNASGIATTVYTSSTVIGTVTITGTEANAATSAGATVTQTAPPNVVTVTANPSSVSPSGHSAVTVTVTNAGAPVPGDAITVNWSGTCASPAVNPLGGTTLANGTFHTTYTAPAATGSGSFCTLTAEDSTLVTGSLQITNTAT